MFKSKTSLSILIILSALAGCNRKNPDTVKLQVKFDHVKDTRIDIVSNNLMNFDTILLTTSKLDSTGSASIEFKTDKPIFAVVASAGRYIPLYLKPGDALKVEADTGNTSGPTKFTGDGASIQDFLRLSYAARQRYEMIGSKYSIQAEEKDFLVQRDSLQKAYAALLAGLRNDQTVSKQDLDMMTFMHRASLIFFQQNYARGHYETDKDMPPSMQAALKDLPMDTAALSTNMYEYGLILNNYLQVKVFETAARMSDDQDIDMSLAAEKAIEKLPFPKQMKEFFKATNVNYWVRMEGLSPEVDTLRANYLKEAKTPGYISTVNKSFDVWAPLAAGKPAPDFAGYTPNGERLSLSMLKGKVVYVDVWATWCGPCKAEFPHSKKLMKEFEGNDKVVFLYLSTDSNKEAWGKMLGDKSVPRGLHIHQKQEKQPDAIWENYLLWGIPRYILIDAEGKIVQAHAPRPSSEGIGDLLRKTVQKQSII